MHARPFRFAAALAALAFGVDARAAMFCAQNGAQLQSALASASGNGQTDEVRIRAGTFTATPPAGVSYVFNFRTNSPGDVFISGGWTGPDADPCQRQVANPAATVLSGSDASRVLVLGATLGSTSEMRLTNLTIADGFAPTAAFGSLAQFSTLANGSAEIVVERVVFRDGTSGTAPGAVYVAMSSGSVTMRNNVITGNVGVGQAGLMADVPPGSSLFLVNNTITGNTTLGASSGGIGVRLTGGGTHQLANNVIWGNREPGGTARDFFWSPLTSPNLMHNHIGSFAGDLGTISAIFTTQNDPRFTGPNDFRPRKDSPLRNTGTAGAAGGVPLLDHVGGARPAGIEFDRGAFEYDELFENGLE